jgi:hypothetical protein
VLELESRAPCVLQLELNFIQACGITLGCKNTPQLISGGEMRSAAFDVITYKVTYQHRPTLVFDFVGAETLKPLLNQLNEILDTSGLTI